MSTENVTDTKIKIVIDESQYARSFKEEESFYQEELGQAKELITALVKRSEEEKKKEVDNQQDHFHQHNIALLYRLWNFFNISLEITKITFLTIKYVL